jgi:hypothetical protein
MSSPFCRPLARRLAWWLIAWMTLASLHPALAAALVLAHGASGAEMVEVCTDQGVRWVSPQSIVSDMATQAKATDDVSASDIADGTPHCPLCRLVSDVPPDLSRSDLRFAPPLHYRAPPPDASPPLSTAQRRLLTAPPRAPPLSAG